MKPLFPPSSIVIFAPARPPGALISIKRGLGFVVLVILSLVSPLARADSILLRGGERLIGRVLQEEEGKIQFESQTLGVMEIPRDRIERIERDNPPPPPEPVAAPQTAAKEEPTVVAVPPTPPPPPPAVTTAAAGDQSTIEPAPPPETPASPVALTVPTDSGGPKPLPVVAPPAPAAVAEVKAPAATTPPPVGIVATAAPDVVPPQMISGTEGPPVPPAMAPVQVIVAPPAVSEPAPAPVFYPWSGLRTEQDTYDWIQLKSGEWLKGEIKSMQDEKLGFDSEEMDYREIDWEDVTMLRSPRMNSVWFEKTGTADGSLLITPKEVRVVSQSGTNTYPRTDLLAITHAGDREFQKWSGEVSLGFNLRTGNAEEVNYNAHINLQRRTPNTRLIFDYLGNFSRINGAITSNNLRETTTFDYFLSRKLYIRAPDAEIYRDPLQNIARRLTLGASVGYDFIRKSRVKWDVSAGPAYQSIIFESVESGDSPEEQSATLVISSHVEIALTKKIDWTLDFRSQYTGQESTTGNTQHINSTLEFDIHKRLNLDISAIWDHVGSPKTNTGGTTPSSDDFRIITSLGIDF